MKLWATIAASVIAATGLGFIFRGRRGRSGAKPGSKPAPLSAEREQWRREIRELADKLGWPGLADFLVVVAWGESRFNPNAANPEGGSNGARGWFQIRPRSGLVGPLEGADPDLLFDKRIAVAVAADYAWRLHKYRGPRAMVGVDWGAIRRGWAYPRLVDDYEWSEPRSQAVRRRLEEAQRATGITVMGRRAFPDGYQWPGLAWALERLGVRPPAGEGERLS